MHWSFTSVSAIVLWHDFFYLFLEYLLSLFCVMVLHLFSGLSLSCKFLHQHSLICFVNFKGRIPGVGIASRSPFDGMQSDLYEISRRHQSVDRDLRSLVLVTADRIQIKQDPTFFRSNQIDLSIVGPWSIVPNLWN
jgi:hypothetical protein